jgi:hypothetical protein
MLHYTCPEALFWATEVVCYVFTMAAAVIGCLMTAKA